jgi:hypothetical protein
MESKLILWRMAGGVEWIQLAKERGRWLAVVNAVYEPLGSGATELVMD